jgi:hypothetical protein
MTHTCDMRARAGKQKALRRFRPARRAPLHAHPRRAQHHCTAAAAARVQKRGDKAAQPHSAHSSATASAAAASAPTPAARTAEETMTCASMALQLLAEQSSGVA